jgi:predicted Rossmann fold nucleotide-binding protein DprA/Smf involved in DNA uptake
MNKQELSYKIVWLEREIAKYNITIENYENKIYLFNNNLITVEQVPISQINDIMDITNALKYLKKELDRKIKDLEFVKKISENLQKPKLAPIVSEIIQYAPKEQSKKEEPVHQMIVEEEKEEQKNVYNKLNNLQEQINDIMNRLVNLELRN